MRTQAFGGLVLPVQNQPPFIGFRVRIQQQDFNEITDIDVLVDLIFHVVPEANIQDDLPGIPPKRAHRFIAVTSRNRADATLPIPEPGLMAPMFPGQPKAIVRAEKRRQALDIL